MASEMTNKFEGINQPYKQITGANFRVYDRQLTGA